MKHNLADKTYARIKKYGWIQEELADVDPVTGKITGVCLLGGMGEAAFKNPEAIEEGLEPLYNSWAPAKKTRKQIDPKFDDAIGTVNAFRKAILAEFSTRVLELAGDKRNPLDVITSFNDHPDTTEEDIRMICKKASAILNQQLGLTQEKIA